MFSDEFASLPSLKISLSFITLKPKVEGTSCFEQCPDLEARTHSIAHNSSASFDVLNHSWPGVFPQTLNTKPFRGVFHGQVMPVCNRTRLSARFDIRQGNADVAWADPNGTLQVCRGIVVRTGAVGFHGRTGAFLTVFLEVGLVPLILNPKP